MFHAHTSGRDVKATRRIPRPAAPLAACQGRFNSRWCWANAGVVRGAGRQNVGAVTNFLSYWCLGMPLSGLLAFRFRLGIYGLWGGLLVATSVQALVLGAVVSRFDWDAEAHKAAARVVASREVTQADEERAELLVSI